MTFGRKSILGHFYTMLMDHLNHHDHLGMITFATHCSGFKIVMSGQFRTLAMLLLSAGNVTNKLLSSHCNALVFVVVSPQAPDCLMALRDLIASYPILSFVKVYSGYYLQTLLSRILLTFWIYYLLASNFTLRNNFTFLDLLFTSFKLYSPEYF